MSEEPAEITIMYRPDEQTAEARCDFPSDAPDDRDDRVVGLFKAVSVVVQKQVKEEADMQVIGGGDLADQNALVETFGTGDEVPEF